VTVDGPAAGSVREAEAGIVGIVLVACEFIGVCDVVLADVCISCLCT
jgi:hypothetical protein